MDYLKLRGSISETGNDILTDNDGNVDQSIQYLNTFSFQSVGVIFNGTENSQIYPTRTPNANITWERGRTYDLGAEMKFLNNRLSIEGDYFYHKRTKMLISRNASLPQTAGITLPRENLGKMRNEGFDALVSWTDKAGDLGYDLSLNMHYEPATIQGHIKRLKCVVYSAISERITFVNPFTGFKTAKVEHHQRFLNKDELDRLIHTPLDTPNRRFTRDMISLLRNVTSVTDRSPSSKSFKNSINNSLFTSVPKSFLNPKSVKGLMNFPIAMVLF